jgi:hypothetical protein
MKLPCEVLSDGSLVPALDEACIESTARRARQALVDGYLAGRLAGSTVEGLIALLGDFLEGQDFRALRAAHPELSGGHARQVRVWRTEEGLACWETLT